MTLVPTAATPAAAAPLASGNNRLLPAYVSMISESDDVWRMKHLGGVSQPPLRRAAAKAMTRISDIAADVAATASGRGVGGEEGNKGLDRTPAADADEGGSERPPRTSREAGKGGAGATSRKLVPQKRRIYASFVQGKRARGTRHEAHAMCCSFPAVLVYRLGESSEVKGVPWIEALVVALICVHCALHFLYIY